MLADVKAVVEIVEKLFGLKGSERDRVAQLLVQISEELGSLAKQWQVIRESLEKSNAFSSDEQLLGQAWQIVTDTDIKSALFEQRSRYQALLKFAEHRDVMSRLSPLNTKAGSSLFDLIEDAISIKGRLIVLVQHAVYPGDLVMEAPSARTRELRETFRGINPDGEGLSEADTIVARYFQRVGRSLDEEDSRLRRSALTELRVATETLAALAGEFRTTAALYKAGQIR